MTWGDSYFQEIETFQENGRWHAQAYGEDGEPTYNTEEYAETERGFDTEAKAKEAVQLLHDMCEGDFELWDHAMSSLNFLKYGYHDDTWAYRKYEVWEKINRED
jgi:hypothetical protein